MDSNEGFHLRSAKEELAKAVKKMRLREDAQEKADSALKVTISNKIVQEYFKGEMRRFPLAAKIVHEICKYAKARKN